MIYKLKESDFYKVRNLIKNVTYELSVLSVIEGIIPGEIYVDDLNAPTSTLITTPECNVLAGDPNNNEFNLGVKEELDFWDHVTLDTEDWEGKLEEIHCNKFLRKYKRRSYKLQELKYVDYLERIGNEYKLEKIDPENVDKLKLNNHEDVIEWVEDNWGDFDNFNSKGAGFYIRNEHTIISWCILDCRYEDKVEMGIETDEDYRRKGFAAAVVAATVEHCLANGVKEIGWHCVDSNIGSSKVAEKVGFSKELEYFSYTPYPPIENISDLNEEQWCDWALFYEKAKGQKEYSWTIATCWANASEIDKTIANLKVMVENGWKCSIEEFSTIEQFSKFKDNEKWKEFLGYLSEQWES